jgi:hypothetical protein
VRFVSSTILYRNSKLQKTPWNLNAEDDGRLTLHATALRARIMKTEYETLHTQYFKHEETDPRNTEGADRNELWIRAPDSEETAVGK